MDEKFYIPKDLDDCFDELKKILTSEQVEEVKNMQERGLSLLHHGLGRTLRNRWGLWAESRLFKWFQENTGLQHPDDMSHIIIVSFWRHLNNEPIDLEGQV